MSLLLLFFFLPHKSTVTKEKISLGIIGGAFSQEDKWEKENKEKIFYYYTHSSYKLKGVDLVILPESAIPTIINEDEDTLYRIMSLSDHIKAPILMGTLFKERECLYNSAHLISKYGVKGIYHKIKLVPFGEYLPLKRFFPFLKRVARGVGNFSPGEKFNLFEVKKTKFATLICFENLFPHFIRKFPSPDFLVVITDDSSFKSKVAAWQHFSHSVMRAAEFSKPLIQVSNMGISGGIDSEGKIISLLKDDALTGKITISPSSKESFYAKRGDWFPLFNLLLLVIFLLHTFGRIKQ